MDGHALEHNQLYLLNSTITGKPYLDESCHCIMYCHAEDAKEAEGTIPDTLLSPPKYFKFPQLAEICFAAGADAIRLVNKGKETVFAVDEDMVPPFAGDHALCANLMRFKQTKKRKYLAQMAFCSFIVPAKVLSEGEPGVVYGIVKHTVADAGMLYVAFSDLSEYALWAGNFPQWSPLKVDYRTMRRICGKNGIMLNPSGNRLVISDDMLEVIPLPEEPGNKEEDL